MQKFCRLRTKTNEYFLRYLNFVKAYINDIVLRFKSIKEHIFYFRIIFKLFAKLNISIKFIKIFIVYSSVILLSQKVNVLNFSTTEERLKAIFEIKFLEIFIDLKHYLKITNYIKNHIYFYSIITDFLQKFKIQLLKIVSNADFKKRQYTNKIKIISTKDQILFFKDF